MIHTGPIRGEFPSLKLGRMVRYSSTIERDLLYFLEYWKIVTWYQEQPFTIEGTLADKQVHRYTPDYEIHEELVKLIAECKPADRLETPQAQQQRELGLSWAETNGYQFVTFTDIELRRGPQLESLKLFWRYARLRNLRLKADILKYVSQTECCSVNELAQHFQVLPQEIVPVVCYLLFHHRLTTDLTVAFSTFVPLWLERQ